MNKNYRLHLKRKEEYLEKKINESKITLEMEIGK